MTGLRVLIVDDHPIVRDGLQLTLRSLDDVEVVGEAATGTDAIRMAIELAPDVVVMDLRLPDVNGIEATREILAARPVTAVLVLTMFEDDGSVFAAMRAGARGYLLKDSDPDEIERAIRAVAGGEAIFGTDVAAKILNYFATTADSAQPFNAFPQLTAREEEILDLIAQGRSNQEISHRLTLSPKTVRNHISNVFAKLQVADRAQAIIRARDAGLGRL